MIKELKEMVESINEGYSLHNREYWNCRFENAIAITETVNEIKQRIDKLTTDIIDKRIVYNTNLY